MATIESCMATAEWQQTLISDLRRSHIFGNAPESELACFAAEAHDEHLPAGTQIVDQQDRSQDFRVLIEGRVRITRNHPAGQEYFVKKVTAPSFMGEVALLANGAAEMTVVAESEIHCVHLTAESFWQVMARCPSIRAVILQEMQFRVRGLQVFRSQQDKLAMLGTMTAGLMHELNNPGAAARRAAAQLRSNLQRMHALARGFSERGHTPEQRSCLTALQERALAVRADLCMSSLQQSDAEEAMGVWMDEHSIAKAWEFAPTLVASGVAVPDLECLAHVFGESELSAPIEWLEATASSMQLVGLVEDSVTRVTELAQAVKSYAHEGQGGIQDLDVNESVHATVVMLKHKLREKDIRIEKTFGPGMPKLHCVCSGLNQVWTNLLDNAIDAVGPGGRIRIRTGLANGNIEVAVGDNGPGIPQEIQEKIFDPFFTTKPLGVGTGLGLGIVQRLIESYNGSLTLKSKPGDTEFVVRIPVGANDASAEM